MTKPVKNLIVITGPTATGKTRLAALVAERCNGEIISADSRQVYCGMDIGSGKDLNDYLVNGNQIPFHLVNIANPGYEYCVYEFQQDFIKAYYNITKRKKQPILCGGTGLYVESVLKGYRMHKADRNPTLRDELKYYTFNQLVALLTNFRPLHNTSDTSSRARLIRAIEVESAKKASPTLENDFPSFNYKIFAVQYERQALRNRITKRLEQRLHNGMIDEVSHLLSGNLKPEQLKYYGLEYRFVTQYVIGEISYDKMFESLNTAIHQFAKRQMTWFRRMERNGLQIHWIDGNLSMEEKADMVLENL